MLAVVANRARGQFQLIGPVLQIALVVFENRVRLFARRGSHTTTQLLLTRTELRKLSSTPIRVPVYSQPTSILAPSILITTLMPAHRSPSTTTRPQTQGPYKIPVIVISSDEEDEPRPAPKRTSRKAKRAKREEILEILEQKPSKHEHPETEGLQRRCHELEQVYARFMQPGPLLMSSFSNFLGTR